MVRCCFRAVEAGFNAAVVKALNKALENLVVAKLVNLPVVCLLWNLQILCSAHLSLEAV
jgi:hypothetical protein